MRAIRHLILTVVIAAAAAPAMAGTVTANLSTVSPSVTNLQVSFNGGAFESCYVGQLNWTGKTGTDTLLGSNFSTYCIDGLQDVYLGSSASWTVGNVSDSPKPVVNFPNGMGSERAARLADFWDRHITGIATNQDAAAFQMGIWEIVYDSPANSGVMNFSSDLFSGNFKLQNTTAVHNDASVLEAQAWLSDLSSTGNFPTYSLYALQSDTLQDQLFGIVTPPVGGAVPETAVPLPAALPVGTAMLGMMGLVAKVRRRKSA